MAQVAVVNSKKPTSFVNAVRKQLISFLEKYNRLTGKSYVLVNKSVREGS